MSVTVITASVGSPLLCEAIASVKSQTYHRVTHWIVVDGEHYLGRVKQYTDETHTVLVLPRNTGGRDHGNYVCHRINAAVPWFVDTTYVCFLDEDNAFEPTHIEDLVRAIAGKRWAHSLRSIMAPDGTVIANDTCESLGGIRHSVLSEQDFHVDTNCYLLETDLARSLSPCWNVPARPPAGRLEADRAVCRTLINSKLQPGVSRKHTVRYRVSGRPDSVQASFFEKGNAVTQFDPQKPDIYLVHFTRDVTRTFLSAREHHPLSEWAMTLWTGLHAHYNVLDGYVNEPIIPSGATVLVTVWHPSALPLDLLKRSDIHRIVFMVESPNIRHADQFSVAWAQEHADVVLSYWKPYVDLLGRKGVWCPMNTHALDLDNPAHRTIGLRPNFGIGRSVAIVLEHRPQLGGFYTINGIMLQCLDPLRLTYATGLRDITCFGKGWDAVMPATRIGHTRGKMEDDKHSVDILQGYVFALIIENCDAVGYVSEKVYDCLMAGCVPLYFGDVPGGLGVDIRQFENGYQVQDYLDKLSDAEVHNLRDAVCTKREEVLRSVGIETYTAAFINASSS